MAPLLRFGLPDGRGATLLLSGAWTVLSVDNRLVSSWDLRGRPYVLVREDGTYRRALDGRLLHKREATAKARRVRRRLSALEGEPIVDGARREAELALAALAPREPGTSEARRRLLIVATMDAAALRDDATRFLAVSGPVGILPPDQYLALVVRATEGCSWNACTFCSLYRDVRFRYKTTDELRAHVAALRDYFGESIALRRSLFLGDANALCLAHERLLPIFEVLGGEFPDLPLFSFLDAWTGHRKTAGQYREYARLGLRRVYIGLETGDPGLLAWLAKPGTPEDTVELVGALHDAGVGVGVIVLLGAGGAGFAAAHVAATASVLTRLRLGPHDSVYFSELVVEDGLEYGRRAAAEPSLAPLAPEACADQRRAILETFHPADPAFPPRTATYDIREFVY